MDTFLTRLAQAYGRRVGTDVTGNFVADRWAGLSATKPHDHASAWSAATLATLMRDPQAFQRVYELFADAPSRDLFVQLMLFRLLGHRHVRLARNNDEHWAQRERAQALQGAESQFGGLFAKLHRFDLEFEGQRVVADCWWLNIAWTFLIRQYYLERNDVLVRPLSGDCVIDAGACFGDTALAFAASVGEQGRVYAFEIDPSNLEIAAHNLALNPQLSSRVTLCEEALGDIDRSKPLSARLWPRRSSP